MRKKLLGPDHADVAGSMTLLASLLIETGRYEEALALATDAKAIRLKALAPDHWRTASAAATEGAALAGLQAIRRGREAAAGELRGAARGQERIAFYVTNSSRWLAKLYEAMGQPAKADRYRVARHG